MEPSGYSWNRERFFQPLGNPFSRRHSQEKCSYCPQIISWETGIFFKNKFKEWSPPSLLHQLELASQVLHGPWKWWKSIGHFFDGCQEFLWCILNRFLWIWNWFWWISCRFRFLTCFSHPPLPGVEDPPPISLLSWVLIQINHLLKIFFIIMKNWIRIFVGTSSPWLSSVEYRYK